MSTNAIDASSRQVWVRAVIIVGVVYFVIGYGFTLLDRLPLFDTVRVWRLAAWIASAVVAAVHIGYERVRLGNRSYVRRRV